MIIIVSAIEYLGQSYKKSGKMQNKNLIFLFIPKTK